MQAIMDFCDNLFIISVIGMLTGMIMLSIEIKLKKDEDF